MGNVYLSQLIVLAFAVSAVVLSWLYFRRFEIIRPPFGVFNITDVAFMIGGIILVPYLYLFLPLWLVGGLLILGALSILYFLWEPVLRVRRVRLLVWPVSFSIVGIDMWAAVQFGTADDGFLVVNNVAQLALVTGLANLWAQSGMRARDAAILGGFLAFYDLAATWLLPLMDDLMLRLAGLPFSPMVGWVVASSGGNGIGTGVGIRSGVGSSIWISIGVGDLLLASVFPLVMRKAFGRVAGQAAMLIALGAIGALMLTRITASFPLMVALGPLMIVQYTCWMRKRGHERPTVRYLQAEPL